MVQIIMRICLLLWVTSYLDSGYLQSEVEAQTLYQNLLLCAVIACCFMVPMVIRMSDDWHLGWSIGISFLLRSVIFIFGFPLLLKPDGYMAFFMAAGMLCTTGSQNVAVESYFSKMIPSDISASLRGVYNFFGQIGVLLMALITGFLYDFAGPTSSFVVIGLLDFALASLTISLCLLGKINPNKKN